MDPDDYESQFENFEAEFFRIIGKARSFIDVTHNNSRASSVVSVEPTYNSKQTGIKPPTIELLSFDGSLNTWINFHNTFQSLIDDNYYLSKIQK